MAQLTSGLRKIFNVPEIYTWFQNFLGAQRTRRELVDSHLSLEDGMSILDVGCGPGDLLPFIKDNVTYFGFDFDRSYINSAVRKWGHRGTFICEDVASFDFGKQTFDRIIIVGVLHHLDDSQVETLFRKLKVILSPNGYLLCLENVFSPGQSPVARYLISMDRGLNVRTPDGYASLCKKHFNKVNFEIRHDLLRIPYTHILIKCR